MNATMDKDGLEISRRKVLGGLGTVGAASAGAGMGTSAFFSDTESFENNQLTAGELDLRAGFRTHYSDWKDGESGAASVTDFLGATEHSTSLSDDVAVGTAGCGDLRSDISRLVVELTDVKPGDFGLIAFELALCGSPANPGYVWANADLNSTAQSGPNRENGVNEAEAADDDESDPLGANSGDDDSGELGGELRLRPFYVGGGTSFSAAFEGLFSSGSYSSIEDFAMDLPNVFGLDSAPTLLDFTLEFAQMPGLPLDGEPAAGSFGTGSAEGDFVLLNEFDLQNLDPTSSQRNCFGAGTSNVFGIAWGLPVDHANEIQGDSVAFDLGFYTEQCRHNDGAGNP